MQGLDAMRLERILVCQGLVLPLSRLENIPPTAPLYTLTELWHPSRHEVRVIAEAQETPNSSMFMVGMSIANGFHHWSRGDAEPID